MENCIREYQLRDPTICDDAIKIFESDVCWKTPGESGEEIRPEVKDSLDAPFNGHLFTKVYKKYIEEIGNMTYEYAQEFHLNSVVLEALNLQKYEPGQGFKQIHYERNGLYSSRCVTVMTYLNDVPDGGTSFPFQDLVTEAKRGKTVLWPCEYTHPHVGVVSETTIKYIITGWLSLCTDDGMICQPAHEYGYRPHVPELMIETSKGVNKEELSKPKRPSNL